MVKRRGQMKIQQMAFMLMAVFVFFILVGLFYITIESGKWKQAATNSEQKKAIEMVSMLASSAEFSCGDYCVDADRLMQLNKRTAYKDFFGLESIEVRTIYPKNTKEILCTESNYPNCNLIKAFSKPGESGERTASSYVALCGRVKDSNYVYYKCDIAKIIVGYKVSV